MLILSRGARGVLIPGSATSGSHLSQTRPSSRPGANRGAWTARGSGAGRGAQARGDAGERTRGRGGAQSAPMQHQWSSSGRRRGLMRLAPRDEMSSSRGRRDGAHSGRCRCPPRGAALHRAGLAGARVCRHWARGCRRAVSPASATGSAVADTTSAAARNVSLLECDRNGDRPSDWALDSRERIGAGSLVARPAPFVLQRKRERVSDVNPGTRLL